MFAVFSMRPGPKAGVKSRIGKSDGGSVPIGCDAGLAGAKTSRRINRDWQPGLHYWPAPHGRSGASITTATMQKCCRHLWYLLFQSTPRSWKKTVGKT